MTALFKVGDVVIIAPSASTPEMPDAKRWEVVEVLDTVGQTSGLGPVYKLSDGEINDWRIEAHLTILYSHPGV